MAAGPTIASRRVRRYAVLSTDAGALARLRAATPQGWTMTAAAGVDALGGFADILQHRFLLLDLDEAAFDPVAALARIRGELMLNIAVLCFGGVPARRDAARLARADRFFERDEIVERMRAFCGEYGW